MAFATRLPKVGDRREHCNERTWMGYHQAPPWERVVAQVGDAGQAKPHLEHHPLSRLGVCHAIPMRKLNGPAYILSVLDRRARFSSWEIACETATRTPGRVLSLQRHL